MRVVFPIALTLALAGLFTSCGTGGDGETAAATAPQEGFQERSGALFDDDSQKIIDRYGAANPMYDPSGRRKGASEGTMVNERFTGEFAQQRYQGDLRDYEKRSFWGRKDYTRKVYGAETDGGRFLREAREGAVAAREGSLSSRESGRVLGTGSVDKPAAREAGSGSIAKPSDAETDIRRRVFTEPEIKDWRPRRALEVEDTRSMLGR